MRLLPAVAPPAVLFLAELPESNPAPFGSICIFREFLTLFSVADYYWRQSKLNRPDTSTLSQPGGR
jgi:hypothetical protein